MKIFTEIRMSLSKSVLVALVLSVLVAALAVGIRYPFLRKKR